MYIKIEKMSQGCDCSWQNLQADRRRIASAQRVGPWPCHDSRACPGCGVEFTVRRSELLEVPENKEEKTLQEV